MTLTLSVEDGHEEEDVDADVDRPILVHNPELEASRDPAVLQLSIVLRGPQAVEGK